MSDDDLEKEKERREKLFEEEKSKRVLPYTFEKLKIKLVTLDQLKKDIQMNFGKYVQQAFELKCNYGDVDIMHAFDVIHGTIVVNEYAFLPLCRFYIENLNE